jgi:hypothetical protein
MDGNSCQGNEIHDDALEEQSARAVVRPKVVTTSTIHVGTGPNLSDFPRTYRDLIDSRATSYVRARIISDQFR